MARELTWQEDTVGGAPALMLAGDLNYDTAPALRQRLVRLLKKGAHNVLLDLSGLHFMDTSGLATLIEMHRKCGERGGKVFIVAPHPLVRQVFEIAHVTGLFVMADSRQAAERTLQQREE